MLEKLALQCRIKISNFQPTEQIIPFALFVEGNRVQLFSDFHN
jgi:hypothetical protein